MEKKGRRGKERRRGRGREEEEKRSKAKLRYGTNLGYGSYEFCMELHGLLKL